ncbi:hypothetical protein FRB99_006529 [Tulasnella sp. 403]|nr:hypothetical protein FRB99_006529 [Tulasnella sp. 403]
MHESTQGRHNGCMPFDEYATISEDLELPYVCPTCGKLNFEHEMRGRYITNMIPVLLVIVRCKGEHKETCGDILKLVCETSLKGQENWYRCVEIETDDSKEAVVEAAAKLTAATDRWCDDTTRILIAVDLHTDEDTGALVISKSINGNQSLKDMRGLLTTFFGQIRIKLLERCKDSVLILLSCGQAITLEASRTHIEGLVAEGIFNVVLAFSTPCVWLNHLMNPVGDFVVQYLFRNDDPVRRRLLASPTGRPEGGTHASLARLNAFRSERVLKKTGVVLFEKVGSSVEASELRMATEDMPWGLPRPPCPWCNKATGVECRMKTVERVVGGRGGQKGELVEKARFTCTCGASSMGEVEKPPGIYPNGLPQHSQQLVMTAFPFKAKGTVVGWKKGDEVKDHRPWD